MGASIAKSRGSQRFHSTIDNVTRNILERRIAVACFGLLLFPTYLLSVTRHSSASYQAT